MYKQLTGGGKAMSGVVLEISMVLRDAVMELVCVFQCGSSFADETLRAYQPALLNTEFSSSFRINEVI